MYYKERKKAKEAGLLRYNTGRPCHRGHVVERYVSTGTCVDCLNQGRPKWKELVKKLQKEWAKNNKEKRAKSLEKYRIKNADKRNKAAKKWRSENPDAVKAHKSTRRARKKNAGGKYSAKQIKDMKESQKSKCVYCNIDFGEKYHIDHIMPLVLGGNNSIENIQLLCIRCNQKKHAKHPEDFIKLLTKE